MGLWTSSIASLPGALNLRGVMNFVSQEIREAEDPEFETFYTKKHSSERRPACLEWHRQDQPHEKLRLPLKKFLPRETLFEA